MYRQHFSHKVKRKAVEDISEIPRKIIHKALMEEDVDTLSVSDVRKIRKNMYNARRSEIPKIPTNIKEIHKYVRDFPPTTNKGEIFLTKNDCENNIIMFSCETNIQFLVTKVDHVYMDGTFEYCPKFFLQLFTVHGLCNNHYIPLVFFLLPDKSTKSYKIAFEYLREYFTPKTVTVDFEIAIHTAIKAVFPNTIVKGCRFHLGQSW